LAPDAWLQDVAAGNGEVLRTAVSSRDQGIEYVMMGLRLVGGI
jgi:hypothetical protein